MTISKSIRILRDYTIVIFNFGAIKLYNSFIDLSLCVWFGTSKNITYIIKIINILISSPRRFTYCMRQHFDSYWNVYRVYANGVRHNAFHVAPCYNKFKRYYTTGPASVFDDTKYYEWLAGLIDGDGYFYERQNGLFSIVITFDIRDKLLAEMVQQKLSGNLNIVKDVNAIRYKLHDRAAKPL